VKKLCENIDDVFVVSDLKKSMPGILSVGFLEVEAETLVKSLSVLGVYVSAGSACTAQQIEVSHVLRAMRVEDDVARGVIRFSLGRGTMLEDLQQTVMCTKKVVESLRKVLL
jgi:cysteine desulfurase